MHLYTFTWPQLLRGILATCSVEISGHHTVELSQPQISLAVSGSAGRNLGFISPDEGRSAAASNPGSAQLSAWQCCLFLLVLHSAEQCVMGMRSVFLQGSSEATNQKFVGATILTICDFLHIYWVLRRK